MKIKTFGYKESAGGYLEILENEWKSMGHEIVLHDDDTSDYDCIFNIDRSQLDKAHEESKKNDKPFHCLVLDIPIMEGTEFEWKLCKKELIETEKEIYKDCTTLLSISEETSRVVKKHMGFDSDCVGIASLSSERYYDKRDRYPYIYYFGRALDPVKNIATVVAALSGTGLELYISGEYCPPEYFKSIAPDVKIRNFGWIDRKDVNTLIKHAHLLVGPELYTGLGMQPIEGVLMGTPCINADIPIKREVWGEVLPLYEPKNVDDCRQKIMDFRHGDVSMEEAIKIAEWYLPERVAQRILGSFK
jgi:hypothetical protein|tara:strand:+ start:1225 stop:2133 length:909 start_codon:yes stop_codon:yes gene_type:complete